MIRFHFVAQKGVVEMKSEYRKLNRDQLKVLKRYDRRYGDGHGHLLIKNFDGQDTYLNEHDVDQWFITV